MFPEALAITVGKSARFCTKSTLAINEALLRNETSDFVSYKSLCPGIERVKGKRENVVLYILMIQDEATFSYQINVF